jgi:hypothetical protein
MGTLRAACLVVVVVTLAGCSTVERSPTPRIEPSETPIARNPGTVRDGRIACFSAAIQRETKQELADETGARSSSLKHIIVAIAEATLGSDAEDLSSFEAGCRAGLKRSGVLSGRVLPMSSSRLFPMFVEMCAETARAAGDVEVAAAAVGAEPDPESIARAFIEVIARERDIVAPEAAVQACTQGFLRGFGV